MEHIPPRWHWPYGVSLYLATSDNENESNAQIESISLSNDVPQAIDSQTFLLADPFWLRKITTYPDILVHVNIERTDDRYKKLQIYISELISDSYEYVPVAYVKMHCVI